MPGQTILGGGCQCPDFLDRHARVHMTPSVDLAQGVPRPSEMTSTLRWGIPLPNPSLPRVSRYFRRGGRISLLLGVPLPRDLRAYFEALVPSVAGFALRASIDASEAWQWGCTASTRADAVLAQSYQEVAGLSQLLVGDSVVHRPCGVFRARLQLQKLSAGQG
jgi:hypothetical protein